MLSAGLVATAMRRLEWRVPQLTVQPPGGATLVNLPTIVFAGGAQTQTLTTTLLTQAVTIEARPVSYAWDFGDGARLVTAKPGRPYPDLDVAHRYPRPGRFQVALATSFVGRFRAGDGPWRPIPGQLVLASTPQPLRVVEARPQLRGE
ncbi:PKD domain-containing protein [Nocardioides sp.]|uniref:PKD domain-containing protein n=1 Tax=Nocardioides sp. TaxID=35761 RepID=UPI0035195969